jgi:hypothetical protein
LSIEKSYGGKLGEGESRGVEPRRAESGEKATTIEGKIPGYIARRLEAEHKWMGFFSNLQRHGNMIQSISVVSKGKSMKRKVEQLANSITEAVSRWNSVECVTLGEHSESDILDPYFALVIDVYLRGSPPTAGERQAAYTASLGQPGAFESSVSRSKDRFFIDEIPVRVEYKNVDMLDYTINRSKGPDAESVWVLKNSGTYMFYRLLYSRILYKKSDWIDAVRREIAQLPPAFWEGLREACQSKMEHYLSDLGAASCLDDGFFYCVSLAGFVRYTAASLFMANGSSLRTAR